MRFIRLQQKYGFKKKGAKGTPRKKTATEKKTTPANESDVTEEETTVKEAAENWAIYTGVWDAFMIQNKPGRADDMQQWKRFLTLTS